MEGRGQAGRYLMLSKTFQSPSVKTQDVLIGYTPYYPSIIMQLHVTMPNITRVNDSQWIMDNLCGWTVLSSVHNVKIMELDSIMWQFHAQQNSKSLSTILL